jgi:alkylhydroperoxidase family enzyme
MTGARIIAVEPPYSEPVTAALDRVMPKGVPPLILFRTLAVNEKVFLGLMASRLVDRGSITLREREVVIDRTCARCGSEYEWGVHVAFFRERAGLTEEQVADTCAADPAMSTFPPRERLLLRLVDELHDTSDVSDRLWRELRAEWTDEQLIELVVLVGRYHLISFVTNAFRIPGEPYAARFPARLADRVGTVRGVPGTSDIELPDIAEFLGRLLQRVSPEQQPLLLAHRECLAAARYRDWADEVAKPDLRAGLHACADREDEIARRVQSLYPEADSSQRDLVAKTSDLTDIGRSLFAGLPLYQQFIQQARGERLGAATWRSFAQDAKTVDARDAFLTCALLEEQNAAFLESIGNG